MKPPTCFCERNDHMGSCLDAAYARGRDDQAREDEALATAQAQEMDAIVTRLRGMGNPGVHHKAAWESSLAIARAIRRSRASAFAPEVQPKQSGMTNEQIAEIRYCRPYAIDDVMSHYWDEDTGAFVLPLDHQISTQTEQKLCPGHAALREAREENARLKAGGVE